MEWTEKIRQKLQGVVVQQSLLIAALDVIPVMQIRIFDKGVDAQGAPLGDYSTKKTWISKMNMVKTSVGAQTRGGKTKRFDGGYAQYKRELGFNAYNLRNFGVLKNEFTAPRETLLENRVVLGFETERNIKLGEIYKRAWVMSDEERQILQDSFADNLKKRLLQ
jgi:hypothetical protein